MTAAAPAFDLPHVTAPPIFDNLLKVLNKKVPSRPTLFEFFLNGPLYARLAGGPAPVPREELSSMIGPVSMPTPGQIPMRAITQPWTGSPAIYRLA